MRFFALFVPLLWAMDTVVQPPEEADDKDFDLKSIDVYTSTAKFAGLPVFLTNLENVWYKRRSVCVHSNGI